MHRAGDPRRNWFREDGAPIEHANNVLVSTFKPARARFLTRGSHPLIPGPFVPRAARRRGRLLLRVGCPMRNRSARAAAATEAEVGIAAGAPAGLRDGQL